MPLDLMVIPFLMHYVFFILLNKFVALGDFFWSLV
jgi:hypothetical protein